MNRRKSRELAMSLLYEISINKENVEDLIETFKENTDCDLSDVDMNYIKKVLNGVLENQAVMDEKIEEKLINWKLNRVSKIDLAILRVAVYEILFEEEIPDIVSVNEGIELAKKYSPDNTGSFINGVLGKFVQK